MAERARGSPRPTGAVRHSAPRAQREGSPLLEERGKGREVCHFGSSSLFAGFAAAGAFFRR